jgi:hyperosmotically inducible protein
MKNLILCTLGLGVALAIAGCDQNNNPTPSAQAANAPADNTRKNARDRGTDALTITQGVRQAVMKDDALSMTAKNVKIITIDGVVTLRGPVKSADERARVAALAQQTGNVKSVDNQLEIAAN